MKNSYNLLTTVFAFVNSGKDDNMAPKEIKGTLCFKVAANSGPRDDEGNYKYPAKWVQMYVKDENLKSIVYGACDRKKLLKFEGVISSQAYIDKEGKPQSQLILNVYDIRVLPSKEREEAVDPDFNPDEFASQSAGSDDIPQF